MFAQDKAHRYLAAKGFSLSDIAAGKLQAAPIDEPNQINGLREIFTEARVKVGYIEVRSIDGLKHADRMASAAFWVGLLYDSAARKQALDLKTQIPDGLDSLWLATCKTGMRTRVGSLDVRDVARQLVTTANTTLKSRGFGEEKYLDPLWENIEQSDTPARQDPASMARPMEEQDGRAGCLFRRLKPMIELYHAENCPYCVKVRVFLEQQSVPYISKPISLSRMTPLKEELKALGGKTQVPFLVDPERGVKMYESDDIIEYVRQHYVRQTP